MNFQQGDNMRNEEAIFSHLSRLLERTDVASNSFKLSSVAVKCDEQLLSEFLDNKPSTTFASLDDFLQNQLYTAAFWGFCDIVTALIEYGVDLNSASADNLWTPLHAACFQEHVKVVQLLVDNGAKVQMKDKGGRACVDVASASDVIWPIFDKIQCTRTPAKQLMKKGLLKGIDSQTSEALANLHLDRPSPSGTSGRQSSSSSPVKAVLHSPGSAQEKSVAIASGRNSAASATNSSRMSSILNWD